MESLRIIVVVLRWGVKMAIDHDMHRARVKAVSDKMSHPMEYNDAGAPKKDYSGSQYEFMTDKEKVREKARDDKLDAQRAKQKQWEESERLKTKRRHGGI